MAIGFARLEYVKRSSGKNACCKSAYNSRDQVRFEGTSFCEARLYNYSWKDRPVHHEILIPENADVSFRDKAQLWNLAEAIENRKNSQVAMEIVVALPDDAQINLEDRKYLVTEFVRRNFVEKGLGAQIDIHQPEPKNDEVVDKNGGGHNWHAHILLTTRRFTKDGKGLGEKARDLAPVVVRGKVIRGTHWGKEWARLQNEYFEEKGLALRVDENGVVPQEHLGPYRLRGRALSLLDEHENRTQLNGFEASDPKKVLGKITETQSVFTSSDVDAFLAKHLDGGMDRVVRQEFWKQAELVQLLDPETKKPVDKFTSREVLQEERRILRLSDELHRRSAKKVHGDARPEKGSLTTEQAAAYDGVISGGSLSCVQGFAGAGKSYLLTALKNTYEQNGYTVRAFGPDNATANVLKEKGFESSENIYKFLFDVHYKGKKVRRGKEVWMVDEAGKLGNKPLLEMLKEAEKKKVQVIFTGCSSQLSSVERGGMFKVFCDRYGSHVLQDIQRQAEESQRNMAKNLAHGEMAAALDQLDRSGGIRWCRDREAAIEQLVVEWTKGRSKTPLESSIIIAHSNREVKILNELVRSVRREKGEIGEREFECQTSRGKILVSVGDVVEFRKNDTKLGVRNGLAGVLAEASPNQFTVRVSEGDKHRDVKFDPREYSNYQLGYASTYHRSQGRTLDRAYVLHSKQITKEKFYVGLTRHVKDAYYFVPKTEVPNLSSLKRMVYRGSKNENSTDFTTGQDLEIARKEVQRNEQIEKLESSDRYVDKAKGLGIRAFGGLSKKLKSTATKYWDRVSDKGFFSPSTPREERVEAATPVEEVSDPILPEEKEIKYTDIVRSAIIQDELSDVRAPKKPRTKTERGSNLGQKLDKLDSGKKDFVRGYLSALDRASTLSSIVESESIGGDKALTKTFPDWQKACGVRNEAAYGLIKGLSSEDLNRCFRSRTLEVIKDQSARHETLLDRSRETARLLQDQLKDNLQPLLYRLFPEGPSMKGRNQLRFGTKGSISVSIAGRKEGMFYDFENAEGGGCLKLIQMQLSLDGQEARSWAKDFLVSVGELEVPASFRSISRSGETESDWVSSKPPEGCKAPSFSKVAGRGLKQSYTEEARYEYKDTDGSTLFYTLRLVNNDTGKKIILPLSYGHWEGVPGSDKWNLKGPSLERSPLFQQELLENNPEAKVLVVEGEKTAIAAQEEFGKKGYVVVSWLGGCGKVLKAAWKALQDRDVVIWPDNDKPGFDAGEKICKELRKVGVGSLRMIERNALKGLPEKWDLADAKPGDFKVDSALMLAREKGLDPRLVANHLGGQGVYIDMGDPKQRGVVVGILSVCGEKLRNKNGLSDQNLRQTIIKETSRRYVEYRDIAGSHIHQSREVQKQNQPDRQTQLER